MTRGQRLALALALLFGGLARFDAVSRIYASNVDQRTDVRRYYQGMAESVLAGRGWLPTYPTNFIPPPGQAVFILIPRWLFPTTDFRQLRILQAVISTLTLWLGFRIASRLWGITAGIVASWLLALYFPLTYYVGTLVPETNYIACLFAFLLASIEAQRRPAIARFALAGGLLGLAVCFKPVPSLLAILMAPWVWVASPKTIRVRCVAGFVLAAWALPGAWILRNTIHYGHVYPVSTNGGTLLALANNPGLDSAREDMRYWDDLYRRGDLFRDAAIESRFASMTDVDGKPEENLKDRAYTRQAIAYMISRPMHFSRNYAIKLWNFLVYPRPGELNPGERPWFFREFRPLQDILVILGLLGVAIIMIGAQTRGAATSLLCLIAYLIAMGALMHLTRDLRMNLPLRALLCLPAAFLLSRGLTSLGLSSAPEKPWSTRPDDLAAAPL